MRTNRSVRRHLGALAALLLAQHALAQQPDTVRVGDKRLHAARLKPGTRQYLVYFVNPTKPKSVGFWLWRRELLASQHQGQPVWRVRQHWYGSDSASCREITSLVRADDFSRSTTMKPCGGSAKPTTGNCGA